MSNTRGPGRPRLTLEERFAKYRLVTPNGCHRWTGARGPDGYGIISIREPGQPRRNKGVHRVAYEHYVGPIPEGFTIDHVAAKGCQYRDCFNPEHLEAVTMGENIRRGHTGKVNHHYATRTHCKNGHEFTPENTRIGVQGDRVCRQCARERTQRRDNDRVARQKAAREFMPLFWAKARE